MKIDANTKISKILKANPAAIEVIAGINKHFRKLRNPILRRALAPRVTIKDAAKIGNVSVNLFLRKLQEIGFEIEQHQEVEQEAPKTNQMLTLKDKEPTLTLDVRPDIEAGNDPFKRIMSAIKLLKEDDILKVINSFEPIPLINLLRQKGFASEVDRPEPGVVITYFFKGAQAEAPTVNQPPPHKDEFDKAVQSFGDHLKVIDVRMLEMPEPMVTILSEIETLPAEYGLLVHHKKFPKFLIAELTNRNYKLIEKKIDANNMDLIIYKVQ